MIIQFNTDKTIDGSERRKDYFTSLIQDGLSRFSEHISRVEIHLTDENGKKEGVNDIRCLLEVRVEGRQPVAVKEQANTDEKAVSGAVEKAAALLSHLFDHRKKNQSVSEADEQEETEN